MRAVKFMLEKVLSGSCGHRVFSGAILFWSVVGSSAVAINWSTSICDREVLERGRGTIVTQGDDTLEFRSAAWGRLFLAIQQAGVLHREVSFLPLSSDGLKSFGMTRSRFQTLRNQLHTTVGGALYDLVLSTTARHVGKRMGEFNRDKAYDARAAEIFYLTYAAAPESETAGSAPWWGSELFGVFPSFKFLVAKCVVPGIQNNEFDGEECMVREMLSSFGQLRPLIEGSPYEEVFVESLGRHGSRSSSVQGRVQFVLMENFQQDNLPASAYRVIEYTRVKAQEAGDVVLPLPTYHVPVDQVRRFAGVLISRTDINDSVEANGRGMRQIGVSLSLGEVEGTKLRVLLSKLRNVLHPSQPTIVTVPR